MLPDLTIADGGVVVEVSEALGRRDARTDA